VWDYWDKRAHKKKKITKWVKIKGTYVESGSPDGRHYLNFEEDDG
jgi:hypothetical protein